MSPLRDDLCAFTAPDRYEVDFGRNLDVVARVSERPAFDVLIGDVATALGLPAEVVGQSLRRHLLTAWEYRPETLRRRSAASARATALLAMRARRGGFHANPGSVLVDCWYPGAEDTFYGRGLLARLGDVGPVDLRDLSGGRDLDRGDVLRVLVRWPRLEAAARRLRRAEGIDCMAWLQGAVAQALVGRALAARGAPAAIVSGNDNGFPVLLAVAAGAPLVLVQNGLRARLSDSAFLWADHYLALAGPAFDDEHTAVHSRFGTIEHVGSLRLQHALGAAPVLDEEARHDVLFVSSLEPRGADFETVFGAYYRNEAELQAIAAVNRLAERGLRVAHYPRFFGESDALAATGLRSPVVEYLLRSDGGAYTAAATSRVVLSTGSTVSVEAAAMGRPVGCIELSGNRGRTAVFARHGVEARTAEEVPALVERLLAADGPPARLGQAGDVEAAVSAAVSSAVAARKAA